MFGQLFPTYTDTHAYNRFNNNKYDPSKYTQRSKNSKIDRKHLVRCITCNDKNDYTISKKELRIDYIKNQKATLHQQQVHVLQTKPLFQYFTPILNKRLPPTTTYQYPKQKKKTRTSNFFHQINSLYNSEASQKGQTNVSEGNKYCQKQVMQIMKALEQTKTMQTMQTHLQQCQNKRLDWQQAVKETMQILNSIK